MLPEDCPMGRLTQSSAELLPEVQTQCHISARVPRLTLAVTVNLLSPRDADEPRIEVHQAEVPWQAAGPAQHRGHVSLFVRGSSRQSLPESRLAGGSTLHFLEGE